MTLPELSVIDTHLPSNTKIRGYTTEQMLAYGKACAAAEREEIAQLADASVNTDKYPTLTMLAQSIRMRGD